MLRHLPVLLIACAGALAASTPTPVSQEEIQWAIGLENKVKAANYQPTAEETDRYQDIAKRLQESHSAPPPPPPAPIRPVSQEEIDWALALQQKVQAGDYQPHEDETRRYTDIFNRYQAQETSIPPAPVQPEDSVANTTDKDIQWAVDLLKRARAGYQPGKAELKRYEAIVSIRPPAKPKAARK